ncbi:MAG: tandem-95 repeat protein, partial [Gemmatimonadota bacterium]|nr:tandem-95 repeat protein [Gemmatimonadota bacterium]
EFERAAYRFELSENVDGRVVALDPDGDPLTYAIVSGDRRRFAVGARDGAVRYVGPGEDIETEPNRFELVVRARDGFGGAARTKVAIEVTNVNEPPVAVDDEAVTREDQAVTVDVLANDTDPEGDRLHIRSVTAAAHGAVRVSGGVVIYTPEDDFHGADSFTYVVSDGRGLSDTATVAVTVLPVNDAPVAVGTIPDQTLDEGGGAVQVDLSPYFGDVDGDALTYGARSNDSAVVLAEVAGAVLTLTPVVYGSATVTVTAWDPAGLEATRSVRVGVSDRPQRAVLGNVLAATARGHLAGLRTALGRRMAADPCEASRLAVMGRSVPLGRTEATEAERGIGEGPGDPFGAERDASPALAADAVPETVADFLVDWGGSQQDDERCRGRWALWGRGDFQKFEGTLSVYGLDSGYGGELATGYLGIETRLDARWLAGVAVSRSRGVSDWRAGTSEGHLTQLMTAVHPYLRWNGGSTSIWASAGAGRGNARNVRATGRTGTSPTDLLLGIVEFEQRLGAPGDLDFALLGDAGWARLRTGSGEETVDRQDIDVNLVRIGLEGSYHVELGGVGTVTPKLEVGARHDGGDGATGFGVELGGGLRWTDPGMGLSLDLSGRTLLAHGDDLRDWGLSAALAYDPAPATERGPSLSLRQDFGGQATGGLDALFQPAALDDRTGSEATSRSALKAAYGWPVFGGRWTGSPHVELGLAPGARDYSLGWRLAPEAATEPDLTFGVQATRRESATTEAEHTVGVEINARW